MAKNDKAGLRQRRHIETAHVQSKQAQRQNVEKPSRWLSNFLTACLVSICLVTAILAFAYATSPIRSVVIDIHDAAGMKWNREYNTDLQKGEQVFTDLVGAESIAVDEQGNWYTGLSDGRLIKISDAGKPTETVLDITGDVDYAANGGRSKKRPHGMRIFQHKLYIADCYQGIFAMDLQTLSWEKILGFDEVSPPLHLPNDLTISNDGVIYFIDTCGRWTNDQIVYSIVEGKCTGRLFKIGTNGKDIELIRDNLCMPNGIELTRDETRLLVSENARHRIHVIDVNTHATVRNIPMHGGGDNIRRSPAGGYWVPLPVVGHPADQFLNRYPFIRDIAIKFLGMNYLDMVANIKQGTILKLNEDLEIVQIHQDLEGKVAWAISQVQEYQPGKLLLASFCAPGIVKWDMSHL